MFTIGQTSGVASRSAPEGEPLVTIKNYLAKMAKCAEDLPSPHVAATKVVEVSQGSFGGGTVVKTSTCGGGASGSGCTGGSSCSGSGGCGGKGCCGGGSAVAQAAQQVANAATACAGGCCGGTGTSMLRGVVDQFGNTNPSIATDISNGGGISFNLADLKSGITYTAPRTNVTPANGTMTVVQPSSGAVTMHVANDGSVTYTTIAPDGTTVPVQGPIGGSIPYTNNSEVSNVVSYAAGHLMDMVRVADAGIRIYNDPIYEASKWLGVPATIGPKIAPTTIIPSTINDILNSSYALQTDSQIAMAENFRATMCDRMPFPECAACRFAHNTIRMAGTDLYDLLYGIQTGLDAIVRGQCAWGEQMFHCPGMLRQMLEQSLGPIGAIVGTAAAATMIATTAVHGAISAFANLATSFLPTDFRWALRDSIGRAICSGGCPNSFSSLIGTILYDLDLPARDLFIGPPVNILATTHASDARRAVLTTKQPVSYASVQKFNTVSGYYDRINVQASKVLDNPDAARISGATMPTSVQDVKIPTTDFRFQPGVTYYMREEDGSYSPLPSSEVTPGLSTSLAVAKYGKVYIDEKDSLAAVADPEKGMELLSTGVMGEVEIPIPLATIPAMEKDGFIEIDFSEGSASVPKCSTNTPTDPIYVLTEDTVADDSKLSPKTYYIFVPEETNPETGVVTPSHYDPIDLSGAYIPSMDQKIYEKIERETPGASELGLGVTAHENLPTLGPVVFDNGLMVEPVVSMDSSSYTGCIITSNLVTDTGISVAEMAKLYKIGLTTDELKLAYALDHEENGSKLPCDCKAVRIPTILDTLPDDEYD